jgi:hypothetical protein
MKQRRFHLPVFVLLLLASATILWKWPRSTRMAAVPAETSQEPEAVLPVETVETVLSPAAAIPPKAAVARVAQLPVDAPLEAETRESIAAVLEQTDPMKNADIQRAVRTLRNFPPEEVTAYFMQSLKEIGSHRPAQRDRLIMVANGLQSKTDLPLWTDLVKRQTPRYPDEEKLRNPPHPTLESRFVDMEQLQAIRNIGLLAREERAARRVLMEIILNPDPSAHRTLHREEAYIALKEADVAASLRVLKQLAAEDELLKRL